MQCKNKYFIHILLSISTERCAVYAVDCITEDTCQNWFTRSCFGDFLLNDDRSGRPAEVDDDKMKVVIESNHYV